MKKTVVYSCKLTYLDLLICSLALFFIFFPWLSFGLNDLDTQPWIVFSNTLFLLVYTKRSIKKYLLFGYSLLIPVLLLALVNNGANSLRGFLSYFIFFSTLHVIYIIFDKFYNLLVYFLPKFNIIWLLAGVIQLIFGKYSLSTLVSVRTSSDRGFTGLAPEPTHYAFFLVCLSWLLLLTKSKNNSKKHILLIFLNTFFVLFVAKSSMGLLYFILLYSYIFISYIGIKRALKFTPIVLIISLLLINKVLDSSESRISRILSLFLSDPLAIINNDASINSRLAYPVLSIYSSLTDFLIPHGFNSYRESAIQANIQLDSYFWYGYESNKILSGTGSVIYELGWFGLTFIFLSYYIMSFKLSYYREALVPFILLWTLLLGAVPISFTLIPVIITTYYFYYKKGNHLKI